MCVRRCELGSETYSSAVHSQEWHVASAVCCACRVSTWHASRLPRAVVCVCVCVCVCMCVVCCGVPMMALAMLPAPMNPILPPDQLS